MNSTVGRKTLTGFFWSGSGKLAEQFIRWVISIALARLLSPADYGLMAITSVLIYFINYVNEVSMGSGIIQRKDIDNSYLSSAFWLILVLSTICWMVTSYFSHFIASFFEQKELGGILGVTSVIFVIMGLGVVPSSILLKELNFFAVAKVNFFSNIIMGLISLAMAYTGYGVWSLVAGSISKSFVFTVLAFVHTSWRPTFTFSAKKVSHLLRFGLPLTGAKALNTVYYNADYIIVGKVLGEKLLGYYYMAFHLATMPVDKLSRTIYDINFSVLSSLQDSTGGTKKHFLQTSKYIFLIIFPLLVGLFLVADDFVPLVLGSKWIPIIYPLKLCCFVGAMRTMNSLIPPLLTARGRSDVILRFSALSTVLLVTGFIVGAGFGINGVILAWLTVYPLTTAYLVRHAMRELDMTLSEYVGSMSASVSACLFMVAAVFAFQLSGTGPGVARMAGSIIVGAASYIGFISIMHREVLEETRAIVQLFRKRRAATR